ncbi:MAG: peptidase [Myxococcaceae bacterium]|nr:peptidase [Myxococcaceae bacterium]
MLARSLAPSASELPALGASNRAFAFDLYRQLAAAEPSKNLLFSPHSISSALAMAYAGAAGVTADELRSALHFELPAAQLHEAFNATDLALAARGQSARAADGTPFKLAIDHQIWAQAGYPILPAYLDTLAVHYGAGVYQLDLAGHPEASRLQINDYVREHTAQLVPELLPPDSLNPRTRLVLTNTIYFDAAWQDAFEPTATQPGPFHKLDGSAVTVPMLNRTGQITYAQGDGFSALALPFDDEQLAFIAVLPDEGAYERVQGALSQPWFDALLGSWTSASLTLSLPRLDVRSSLELSEPLRALGMVSAFDDADFSNIDGSTRLRIQHIFHQASVQTTEQGTVAAAATAVVFGVKHASMVDGLQLRFDRPFFFAILDRPTGAMLFLGRVLDPSTK